MATENEPYHFDYQALDRLLTNDYDPQELGNKLDEIMTELVSYARRNEDYRELQEDRHYVLKLLRDILWWKLPKTDNH